ncbi:MAG TPA: SIMPL domain-containing protein, partial [Gemmatimonadaceae bacterium]
MRNSIVMALAMLPSLAQGQGARMDASDPEPRIVVTATRTTRMAPDRAALYITVEGSGETPTEAARRASQKLQAVTTALQPFGGGSDAIVSVPYGVAPAPNGNGFPGSSSQTSFIARYVLRVQPSRIDQITPLAVAAIAAGASSATPPTFEASGADSAKRQRYGEALAQARRDAEALATALGGRLGAVIEVSSNNSPQGFQNSPAFVNFISGYEFRGPVQ